MEDLKSLLTNLVPPRRIDSTSETESTLIKQKAHSYHDTIYSGIIHPDNEDCSFCIEDQKYFTEHRHSIRRKVVGLPTVERTFATFKPRQGLAPAIRLCKEFCDNMEGFLVLYGGSGVGKSHLLQAIGEQLVDSTISLRYTTVDNLLSGWRSLFSSNEDQMVSFETSFTSYAQIDLLLLDDLGSEKPSEWSISTLTRLIDTRQSNGNKSTCLTTNQNDLQLEKAMGTRIADRIYSQDNKIVVIDAPSYRRKRFTT